MGNREGVVGSTRSPPGGHPRVVPSPPSVCFSPAAHPRRHAAADSDVTCAAAGRAAAAAALWHERTPPHG